MRTVVEADPNLNSPLAARWLFPRLWAATLLTLILVTWPLWFPAVGSNGYPAVSFFPRVLQLPPSWLSVLSFVLTLNLLWLLLFPARSRICWSLVALTLTIGFALDQHRLQPWAYQSAIYAIVFAGLGPAHGRRWLIVLAASIYIYSGAGKLDYQFAYTVGQDFLAAAAKPLGGVPAGWQASTRAMIALGFPLIEILAGCGLLIRKTRAAAAGVVIAMHLALIAVLGPWGLDHSTGVLVWNVALIAQAWLLFLRRPKLPPNPGFGAWPIHGLLLAALLAPLGERFGYWDHWPSWALYAPHTSRVEMEIHASAADRIPAYLRNCLRDDLDGDRWHRLDLACWSLAQRKAPVYPQARYQLELSRRVTRRYKLGNEVRVRWRGTADRWTGRRKEQWLLGEDEISRRLELDRPG